MGHRGAGKTNYQTFAQVGATQLGQVSDQPLNAEEANAQIILGVASTLILAAGDGIGRTVTIKIRQGATTGGHIKVGTALTSHFLLEPGQSISFPWNGAAINGIRGGAVDVTIDLWVLEKT